MKLNNKKFQSNFKNNLIFEKKPTIAVAVSGGPDSMSLLFLLNEWCKLVKGKLIALIVSHNLRNESLEEAELIFQYIKDKGIDAKILKVKKYKVVKKI